MQPAKRVHSALAVMTVAAVVVLAVVLVAPVPTAEAASVPPAHCNPEIADALPPRLRRICAALYGIAEISSAVEQYLDDKTMRDSMPMLDSDRGVKRQDVDHVFLRFGRR